MSNPANPLGKFQTYAYHHMLAICDSTETGEALATSTADLSRFHNRHNDPDTFNVNERVQNVAEVTRSELGNENDGNYIVLLNGTTDAQFIITKASWTSLLAPEQKGGAGGSELSSMEFDGELEIIEPLGARFMKVIADATKALNRDPVGLTWVLRTIFVGHLPNGQTETISNIKGVMFMVTDIEAQFDESGARYAVKFIGTVNGVGHMPAVQQIARGCYLPVTKDLSVKKALENYADVLNTAWLAQKESLKHQVSVQNFAVSSVGPAIDIDFDNDFVRVNYEIVVDKEFEDFPAGTNEQIAAQNKGDGDAVIAPGEVVAVDAMIKRILDSSEEIQQLVEGKHEKNFENVERATLISDTKPRRFMYKILSGLTSTPNLYTITYFVKLFEVPTSPFRDIFGGNLNPAPGQFIEFDYIFTGKNTDILEFDMTMQMGLAFLQVVSSTNNTPNQTEYLNQEVDNSTTPTTAVQRASDEPKRKTRTPLFLGMKLSDPIFRHKKNKSSTINFQTLFGRWAGLENMEAKVKIAGNSQLLSDTSALPSELAADSTTPPREVFQQGEGRDAVAARQAEDQVNATQQAIRSEESTVAPSWTTRPVLMKINIKFPTTNAQDGGAFESFWWNGFYYLFSIRHVFEDGLFTQELEMFSIIEDDGLFGVQDDKEAASQILLGDTDDIGNEGAATAEDQARFERALAAANESERLNSPIVAGDDFDAQQVSLPSGIRLERDLDELPDFSRPADRRRLGKSGASRELTRRSFAESVRLREIRRNRLEKAPKVTPVSQGLGGDESSF